VITFSARVCNRSLRKASAKLIVSRLWCRTIWKPSKPQQWLAHLQNYPQSPTSWSFAQTTPFRLTPIPNFISRGPTNVESCSSSHEKHIVDPWPYMISSLHERVFAPRTSLVGKSEEHDPYDVSNDRYDQARNIIYHNIWRRCMTGDLAEYWGFLNSCRTVRTEFCEQFHFYMQMFY
jgi:hypothetical protein